MKFSHQLVISALAVLVLSACSSSPEERRQAKNDFAYIDATLDKEWVIPEGAKSEFYPQFTIPEHEYNGKIGPEVDIRPPQQIIDLIPGARTEKINGDVYMWLTTAQQQQSAWDTVHQMVEARNLSLRTNTDTLIETDWLDLSAEDESLPIAGRYNVSRVTKGAQYGLVVSLLEWKENNKAVELTPELNDRYATSMVNFITTQYNKKITEEARLKALARENNITVAMGTDRSGLPVIVARAPYALTWDKLYKTLPPIGFEIKSSNQSQGSIEADYESPISNVWRDLGVDPLILKSGKYNYSLGDLENRTSINLSSEDGTPVSEEQLRSLLPVLQKTLGTSKPSEGVNAKAVAISEEIDSPQVDENLKAIENPKAAPSSQEIDNPTVGEDLKPIENPKATANSTEVANPKASANSEEIANPKATANSEEIDTPAESSENLKAQPQYN